MKLGKRTERRYTEQDKIKKSHGRDFPGGPMVKILYFQCKEHEFNPWLGAKTPSATWHRQKKREKKEGWKRMGLMEVSRRFRREMLGEVPCVQLMVHTTSPDSFQRGWQGLWERQYWAAVKRRLRGYWRPASSPGWCWNRSHSTHSRNACCVSALRRGQWCALGFMHAC